MYAHVERGALVRFLTTLPPTFKGVRAIGALTDEGRAALGLLPLVDVTPVYDSAAMRLANARPVVVVFGDRVEMTRVVEAIPAVEIARRAAREAMQNDPRAVDLRNRLGTATPAEIDAWVDAQVTDLASARTMFKRILVVLALLSR